MQYATLRNKVLGALRASPILGAALAALASPSAAQTLSWTRQFGTQDYEYAYGVAADDAGNAYVTGTTYGSLAGPNEGSSDFFLAKYDASGTLLWKRQHGTWDGEEGYGVSVDGAGNAYVIGQTYGDLGGPPAGNGDAFLAKYDAEGDLRWVRQVGSAGEEFCNGVAADRAGNVYIFGMTYGDVAGPNQGAADAYLVKFNASGTLLWKRQFGTPLEEYGNGVAVDDAGNAWITGATQGSLAGPNAGREDFFLAKYDASGALLWMRQAGTSSSEGGVGVDVDSAGNAFVAGGTDGNFGGPNAGGVDLFLAKYDASGLLLWSRQGGTSTDDYAAGVALDGSGHAFITGATNGALGGPNAGFDDLFVAGYDTSGAALWTRQAGTPAFDGGYAVAAYGAGNAYVAGFTGGSLGGPNAGLDDALLLKYVFVCYADCDQSTGVGVLDIFDFLCFQNRYAINDPYACDCDMSTGAGVCDIFDFLCFQNAFAAGCR